MAVLTLGISARICILAGVLPSFIKHRPFCRADLCAAGGSFALCWLLAAAIYAAPGLTVGFGGFRLLAVCVLALAVAGCLCAWRLAGGAGRHRPLLRLAVLLAAAVCCEGLLFNAPYFATHDYTPVNLLDYLSPDAVRNENGGVEITEETNTLHFSGIDQPLYNLSLADLQFHYEGDSPEAQNPLFTLVVQASDESSSAQDSGGSWGVALKAPRSYAHALDFSGKVRDMTLTFEKFEGEYTWYQLNYTVGSITANAPRVFDFSLLRCAALFLLLAAVFFLRPGSLLWRTPYLDSRRAFRPLVVAAALALMAFAAAAPFADPGNSGIATAGYNVNNWDGESRLSFTAHINDWQHDANAQYGALAHSLLNGRLDLMADPPDALTAMENPYDTVTRQTEAPDALWDVAYRGGRYYVYFGIVPCLLFQLPFEALTGIPDLPPCVGMIVMAWAWILAIFGLLREAFRRWFPTASVAAYLLGAVGITAGSGMYYLLFRAHVYEYAILCGAAFVSLGLWQWLCAARSETHGRICLHLILGSLCIALVAGCRPQMEVFAFLALPIFRHRYITEKRLKTKAGLRELGCFILPVVLVAAGLMWYNAARFGSPFDFGANYNLTSNDMTKRGFRLGRLAPALFYYFLDLPAVQAVFPYLTDIRLATNFIGKTTGELLYGGALALAPVLWSLPVLFVFRKELRQKRLSGLLLWCALGSLLLAALDCEMAGILYRYQADFLGVLLFAAVLCWLAALEYFAARPRPQRFLRAALLGCTGMTCLLAFLVVFAAEPWLSGKNPMLFQTVSRLIQFWL